MLKSVKVQAESETGCMPLHSMHDNEAQQNPYELVLADLCAQKAALEAKLIEIEAVIAAIERITGKSPAILTHSDNVEETEPKTVASQPESSVWMDTWQGIPLNVLRKRLHGKSIADAAIAIIVALKRPVSEADLIEGLRLGGVTFVSKNPSTGFRFAMLRKRKETGAVYRVGKDEWNVSLDWKESSADQPEMADFTQEKVREDHVEAARKGLQAAKERGVKLGRRPYFTQAVKDEAVGMMAQRVPLSEVAQHIGTSITTLQKWRAEHTARHAADQRSKA